MTGAATYDSARIEAVDSVPSRARAACSKRTGDEDSRDDDGPVTCIHRSATTGTRLCDALPACSSGILRQSVRNTWF